MCLMACGLLGCLADAPSAAQKPQQAQVRRSKAAKPATPAPAASAPAAAPASAPAADADAAPAPVLQISPALTETPAPPGTPQWLFITARHVSGQADQGALAEGDVELRRQGMVLKADRILFDASTRWAKAQGGVTLVRDGNRVTGPSGELHVDRSEGTFAQPAYFFPRANAGGEAKRLLFLGADHLRAERATYSSCPKDDKGEQDWVLSADQLDIQQDKGEGHASGAVLRFKGVPILALPSMSFPVNGERRSGWLAPFMSIDTEAGFGLAVPWYWNIAPNIDATLTPFLYTRRGEGLGTEVRYLTPSQQGELNIDWMPRDRIANRSRWTAHWQHASDQANPWGEGRFRLGADTQRASDDAYWRDFPRQLHNLTPRLLSSQLWSEWSLETSSSVWRTYARTQSWQVLQEPSALMVSPYSRLPQVGASTQQFGEGWQWGAETEFNRFRAGDPRQQAQQPGGDRVHALTSIGYRWETPNGFFMPRFQLNAAAYRVLDATGQEKPQTLRRTIPTFSIDSGLSLERNTMLWGQAVTQTLEPRVLYVNTPFRQQDDLPNFDSAPRDFNELSLFSPSSFSGVDRVSDDHKVVLGLQSRFVNQQSGAEDLRLGIAQRVLLRDSLVTASGAPDTQRLSDVMLMAATGMSPLWQAEGQLQYSPEKHQFRGAAMTARYNPRPDLQLYVGARGTRGLGSQVNFSWLAPLGRRASQESGGGTCSGRWYQFGRLNYSVKDQRLTEGLLGVEYDSGCWVGRIVAQRVSTGVGRATTRLMFQLELMGLGRLGPDPLKTLKDNIPGYQTLRNRQESSRSDE